MVVPDLSDVELPESFDDASLPPMPGPPVGPGVPSGMSPEGAVEPLKPIVPTIPAHLAGVLEPPPALELPVPERTNDVPAIDPSLEAAEGEFPDAGVPPLPSVTRESAPETPPAPPLPPPAEELIQPSPEGFETPAPPSRTLPEANMPDVEPSSGEFSPPIPPAALNHSEDRPVEPLAFEPEESPTDNGPGGMTLPPLPGGGRAAADGPPDRVAGRVEDVVGRLSSNGLDLPDQVEREVEEIARRQREEVRGPGGGVSSGLGEQPDVGTGYGLGDEGMFGGSSTTQYGMQEERIELPRPPSPTQARPIRAIPVPEEFVSLQPRQWEPSRKVWAAPATAHGPLYFQDAVLERYGQSVEQALGPHWGRYASYPLDDPKQSRQRNQILQPFYSMGLFAGQVALLPYNLLVDPPWEPEYDLGYYRPADRIPPDTYYLPTHGIGPPLHGRNY